MSRLRILNAEPFGYCDEARDILLALGDLMEQECDRSRLVQRVREYDVLIVRLANRIDKEVLDAAGGLKVIVTATTGLDHIDLGHAALRGIEVLSLKGEVDFLRTVPATAELTWGLLLALVRKIPWACQSVRDGSWDRDEFKGSDLAGKRLGVLGLGRIGRKVAAYGSAFGMCVSAYDPYCCDWPAGVERIDDLKLFLGSTDVLSVHVPLNDETVGMLGEEELNCLPDGAVVVNTSRGGIVDELALAVCLNNGKLAGVALDVMTVEQGNSSEGAQRLLSMTKEGRNIVITPHIGGATKESMAMTEVFMARKLAAWAGNSRNR